MDRWRGKKTEGIKLAANPLYAHSTYSRITAIIVISAFSSHSVKAVLNSSRTLLAPVNLQLERGQPISSWCAAINDVYKEPRGLLWVFRRGCTSALSAILLNTARTHTPVLSRCLSICTKCHNITFLMETSTSDAHSQQRLTNTPKPTQKSVNTELKESLTSNQLPNKSYSVSPALRNLAETQVWFPVTFFSFIKFLFFVYC